MQRAAISNDDPGAHSGLLGQPHCLSQGTVLRQFPKHGVSSSLPKILLVPRLPDTGPGIHRQFLQLDYWGVPSLIKVLSYLPVRSATVLWEVGSHYSLKKESSYRMFSRSTQPKHTFQVQWEIRHVFSTHLTLIGCIPNNSFPSLAEWKLHLNMNSGPYSIYIEPKRSRMVL